MRTLLFFLLAAPLAAPIAAQNSHAVWNQPQEPFRIFGNTYYVGPHGLGSVLITSDRGHVLIDGALPESAKMIAAHIRSLGFRLEDVKLIVNSHAHDDHAGGIAELQRLSGARVAASPWTADVMKKGAVARDDPQFGILQPIHRIARVEILHDGETLTAGGVKVTAHFTPGHTPGGTSWTWQSCENGRCLNLVYADSLTPASADGFKFEPRKSQFEQSYAFLDSVPCDILITPHPDVSNLFERKTTGFVNPAACRALAASSREQLRKRLAADSAK